MSVTDQLRAAIREEMTQRRLSFYQVSQETGVQKRTLDHVLSGNTRVAAQTIDTLADWLNLELQEAK